MPAILRFHRIINLADSVDIVTFQIAKAWTLGFLVQILTINKRKEKLLNKFICSEVYFKVIILLFKSFKF